MTLTPVTEQLPKVLQDVTRERARQIGLGYPPEHDDQHHPSHMLDMTRVLLSRADDAARLAHAPALRSELVQAIALLCATVETLDRRA